jgi:hypothetical protein
VGPRFAVYNGRSLWRSNEAVGWNNADNLAVNSVGDLFINRDAANTLGQRNSTNPQTFNIYNTFTDASNHERGFLRWSSNVFQIGTEKGSGGGTVRNVDIRVGTQSSGAVFSASGSGMQLSLRNVTTTSTSSLAGITLGSGHDIVLSTTTGTKIGTATNQLLGFFNATPVDQPALTADLLDSLQEVGLIASGSGDTPLNLSGGTLTAGNLVLTDSTGSETATFDAQGNLTANRTYDLPDASGTLALTAQLTDTQIFTANGTWTKPAGAKMVHYLLIGGGGGGGAGRRSLQNNTLGGGGGGAGGGITVGYIDPAFLGSTESITVAAGGTGAADSADNSNGASGTAGGDSSLGSFIKAKGGAAGGGGTFGAGAGGAATTIASLFYGSNASTSAGAAGAASAAAPSNAAASVYLPTGGGGGGARGSSTNGVGSKGGDIGQTNTGITSAPSIAAGTNGPAGIRSQSSWAGTGGGGGSMSSDSGVYTGFSGGNGGLYGGGGGGGSGAVNASGGSTAGGTGANGIVIITTYF